MATILEESGFDPNKELKIVGTNPVKHDGLDKVTGRAKFGADLFLPGMLHGKILRLDVEKDLKRLSTRALDAGHTNT